MRCVLLATLIQDNLQTSCAYSRLGIRSQDLSKLDNVSVADSCVNDICNIETVVHTFILQPILWSKQQKMKSSV